MLQVKFHAALIVTSIIIHSGECLYGILPSWPEVIFLMIHILIVAIGVFMALNGELHIIIIMNTTVMRTKHNSIKHIINTLL